MNSRNSFEEMKKMREAAIKRAKATQAKSQSDRNSSRLEIGNSMEAKKIGNKNTDISKDCINVKNAENNDDNSKYVSSAHNSGKSGKLPFEGITKILKDVLQDTDKTLILVLIFLLMDEEENFPILLVLFYLLI